jgi:hypothetical protein
MAELVRHWRSSRIHAQLSVSVQADADCASAPLNWRLFVPESWDAPTSGPACAAGAQAFDRLLNDSVGDMKYDKNRNAKLIIPLALIAWIGGIVLTREGVPTAIAAIFVSAFAVAVPGIVFYLIGEAGWRLLAKRYRATAAQSGEWHRCPTGQMARVGVDHPDFRRVKMRFVGSLRVATNADALHLSTLVSGVPVLSWFFPSLEIPWAAVSKAHEFEAPGWFTPGSEPGAMLQVAYDPNYTGKFIEMEVGDPPVFIQLPAWILGENLGRIPGLTR